MKLLGITGQKQSGKDTVYGYLLRKFHTQSVVRLGFADSLKQEIAMATGWSKSSIEEHKDNFRLIMQGWGTDFRRKLCGDDYWLKKMFHKLADLPDNTFLCVITDVRFLNEADLIQKAGGKIWRVNRYFASAALDPHQSEQELFKIKEDHIISNTRSLLELEHEVDLAWQKTMTTK